MKHYQIKISLEQFKSRMPSIIPAYYANNRYYSFNGKGGVDIDGNRIPYSNYGLYPFSIKLVYQDIWGSGDYYNKVISYNQLAKWYHFLNFYVTLLTTTTCSLINYQTAQEYYNLDNQKKYSLEECINFDAQIISICGKDDNLYQLALKTYNYLTEYYFPCFIIDSEMQNQWHKKKLSIQEANYWLGWFEQRIEKYQTVNNCSLAENCCDCEEFFRLGGMNMYNQLKYFIQNINTHILDEYVHPQFNLKIILTSQINNLGEFTSLYESWEGGVNYSNNENNSGAVVEYNGLDWVLVQGKGYFYNDEFKEFYFGNINGMNSLERQYFLNSDIQNKENQFERLIDIHGKQNDGINFNYLLSIYHYYIYDINNQKIFLKKSFNDYIDENKKNLIKKIYPSYQINVNPNNFFFINGQVFPSEIINYIQLNNEYYIPIYDSDNQPIIIINNMNYYGIYDEKQNNYYFKINNSQYFLQKKEGVIINDFPFFVNQNIIQIGNLTYEKFYAYANINNSITFFNNDYDVIVPFSTDTTISFIIDNENTILGDKFNDLNDIKTSSYGYYIDDNIIYILQPFIEYDASQITGYTESKLSSFSASTDIVYDNLGNKFTGITIDQQQLTDNCLISIPYKPQTVIHLSPNLNNDGEQITNQEGYKEYWGDYLESIQLYYVDTNNQQLTKKYNLEQDGSFETILNLLFTELNGKEGTLKCDFSYYMGCILQIKNSESNGLEIKLISNGIHYIDNTTLSASTCQYYLTETSYLTLNYYDIIHDTINYFNDSLNYLSVVNKAYFNYDITKFYDDNNEFNSNGWTDFPQIKEEYMIGISSLNNVDVDIYINRGVARAFDSHLKLLEVNSLESLEQYGNGSFKINNN